MPRPPGEFSRAKPRRSRSHTNFLICVITGGRLVVQYVGKRAFGPRCGDCGTRLPGIPALRPKEYKGISKRQKTITRAYGGSRCANCVKTRIVRAFLIEEQKIVKKVLQAKKLGKKKKSKKKSKKN